MKIYGLYKILSMITIGKLRKKYQLKYDEDKNSYILQQEEKRNKQLKQAQIFAAKQYYQNQRKENNNIIIVIDENGNHNISDYVEGLTIDFLGENSTVTLHYNDKFKDATIYLRSNVSVIIGEKFSNNPPLKIYCLEPNTTLTIGNDCMLSWDVTLHCMDHHAITQNKKIINNPTSVTIGNHVWIGHRAIILKNSYIPDNSIIGAGAVYTASSFAPKNAKKQEKKAHIFAGNPAKCIKDGNFTWHREKCYLLKEQYPEFK